MVRLIQAFSRIQEKTIFVLGDLMLDTYTTGVVSRISPEAPVPILHVKNEYSLPGGAGNVMLNLVSLGAKVLASGRVGRDREGEFLKQSLAAEQIDISGIFVQEGFDTPVKNRLIANAQQLLRIDREEHTASHPEIEKKVVDFMEDRKDAIDAITISDYGKAFLTPSLLKAVIAFGNQHQIPLIVDPKGDDFMKYRGVTVIKPNLGEAYLAAKLPKSSSLDEVAESLLATTCAKNILITRSEQGISLFDQNGREDFPVRSKEVKDVTGAGDTVCAVVTMMLANHIDFREGLHLANVAAGISIERVGCVRVSLSEMAKRLLETDVTRKIYEEHHLFALEHVLKEHSFIILRLDRDDIAPTLFSIVQSLEKRYKESYVMLYIASPFPEEYYFEFLASLKDVDFIVLQQESLMKLCVRIKPHAVFTLERGKLIELEDPRFLVMGET